MAAVTICSDFGDLKNKICHGFHCFPIYLHIVMGPGAMILVFWMLNNWCFWTLVLEKTLESSLDCKETQSVHPKGDQSWVFIGGTDVEAETPILWPPHANSWLIWKDPDAGKDWGQEEKGMTEDEMVGWHHWHNGQGFGWTHELVMDREAWRAAVHGVTKSRTWPSDWTELNWMVSYCVMYLELCIRKMAL